MGLKRIRFIMMVALLPWLCSSCKTIHPEHPVSVQQSESVLAQSVAIDKALGSSQRYHTPSNVNSAMLPPLSRYVTPTRTEQPRFDVTANKVPAKEFFMGL